MEQVYVLMAYGGEYDSQWDKVVRVYRNQVDAEVEEDRLEKLQKRMLHEWPHLFKEYNQYVTKNQPKRTVDKLRYPKQDVDVDIWRIAYREALEVDQKNFIAVRNAAQQFCLEKMKERGTDEDVITEFGLYETHPGGFYVDADLVGVSYAVLMVDLV